MRVIKFERLFVCRRSRVRQAAMGSQEPLRLESVCDNPTHSREDAAARSAKRSGGSKTEASRRHRRRRGGVLISGNECGCLAHEERVQKKAPLTRKALWAVRVLAQCAMPRGGECAARSRRSTRSLSLIGARLEGNVYTFCSHLCDGFVDALTSVGRKPVHITHDGSVRSRAM